MDNTSLFYPNPARVNKRAGESLTQLSLSRTCGMSHFDNAPRERESTEGNLLKTRISINAPIMGQAFNTEVNY
jgi:hypothetical protein